jgi:maltooligosyltrehalose trehalohydrolase
MRAEVWAPHAAAVDLVLGDGSRHALEAHDDGWFRGGPPLAAGDRYGFSLDGGEPLPDPRSRWQPDGVHGLSAVDDPAAHEWHDDGWAGIDLLGGVLYELHVGTFTPDGTFDAAIERLDDLVDLGVTAVELLPVAEAMGERGWGYDGVALWAPHHAYGGPAGLRRFVDAAHGRGLGVLLDVVYNHLGPEGNHLARFGPYFTDRHQTPWGPAVNLDGPGSTEVRRFLVDNALHWCTDHHLDGLRLDAVHALLDDRPVHVVAELTAAVHELGRRTGWRRWVVVEREQHEVLPLLPPDEGGWGADARWADDLHHALHAHLTGERDGYYASFGRLGDVATALLEGQVRDGDPLPDSLPATCFVTCAQNHDQVGNRAAGERLHHLTSVDAAKAAAALVLLGPGTPLLFQGEEWAASSPFPYFCDTDDRQLAAAIRDGRRAEFEAFGWPPEAIADPLAPETAAGAVLRWAERAEPPHRDVLAWYRTLVRLRADEPAVATGGRAATSVHVDDDAQCIVLRRGPVTVATRLAATGTAVLGALDGAMVATSGPVTEVGPGRLELGPFGTAVLRCG